MRWMLGLIALLTVAGCALRAPKPEQAAQAQPAAHGEIVPPTPSARPKQSAAFSAMPAEAAEVAPLAEVPSPVASELLIGLPQQDIAEAQALAKRIYMPRWPVIAERARFALEVVWQRIDALDAPRALAWIPVVESGYEPYALSPSGALGLWQLMPKTARFLGLRHSHAIDARRALASSTDAAVRYLLMLHARFGNWPLAIAAYHMGPGALSRALSQTPWLPQDGLDALPAPEITRTYVKCVLGLVAAHEAGAFAWPEPIGTVFVAVQPPVDLIAWAKAADEDALLLFRLNPGLEHSQLLHEPITLRIPRDRAARWQKALASARPQTSFVVVRRGDTFWRIARRIGISTRLLATLNPGVDPHRLRPGIRLIVPAKRAALRWLRARPNPLVAQGRRVRYTVRPGDTLWAIARRFGTTAEHIARINAKSKDALLRPGEVLWILARPSSS